MSDSPKRRFLDSSKNRTTILCGGAIVTGEITGTGDFLIGGHVEGSCDVQGTVTLSAEGSWTGTIKASNVIILGEHDGDIVAESRIEIGAGARVSGTVSAMEVAVAEGAIIEGDMNTTGAEAPISFSSKRATDPES